MRSKLVPLVAGLLVAVSCQALTIYETFDTDPVAAGKWFKEIGSSSGSSFTWTANTGPGSTGGFLSAVVIRGRGESVSARYYTPLGQRIFGPGSTATNFWFECDFGFDAQTNTSSSTLLGIMNSAAKLTGVAQFNGVSMTTGQNAKIRADLNNILGSTKTQELDTTALLPIGGSVRMKYHAYKTESGNYQIDAQVIALDALTGTESGTITKSMTTASGDQFLSGMDILGIVNNQGSSSSAVNRFVVDNIYFSTDSPNFAVVPEPATMAILGFGSLLLARRRN